MCTSAVGVLPRPGQQRPPRFRRRRPARSPARRRGREQTWYSAQVFPRDRVRTAAMRVCGDRLAVGKVDDRQQDDDQGADWPDVAQAGGAQGNEQGKRRLRAVCSRAKSIQPQHRDAGEHADALLPFLEGCQPSSEEVIKERHRRESLSASCWLPNSSRTAWRSIARHSRRSAAT